jgi:hypothetical protein
MPEAGAIRTPPLVVTADGPKALDIRDPLR